MERLPKLETMSEGMAGAQNYYDWIYRALRPYLGKSVLEIGPGYGAFAERIIADRRMYYAIDVEDKVISRLRKQLNLDGNRIIVGDVSSREWYTWFQQTGVDTILSMNVLEHIENDVEHLKASSRSAPGGRFVLFVPAIPLLYGSWDKEAGHFRRYSRSGLKHVIAQAGLSLRHISYFNALGAISWFISNRVLGLEMHTESTIRSIHLYDRLGIPLSRLVDPLMKVFWGQSLLAVADIPK